MKKGNISALVKFITIVFVIISVLLLFGLLFGSDSEKSRLNSGENKLDDKIKKRKELEAQIAELKENRAALLNKEKKYFLWARIGIGTLLVGANIWYLFAYNMGLEIGSQVDFNGAIILSYSLIAFIISGTPTRFAKFLRIAIINRLRKKQIHVFMELEILEKMYKELNHEIMQEHR